MHRIIALAALPLLVVPALAGCVIIRGPLVSEEREVDAVTSVVLDTSGELVITIGEPSLTITAPRDQLDRLTSTSSNGELVLGRTGSGMFSGEVRYTLSLPLVESIEVNGSGDVDVDFTGAEDVVVVIEGSGDVDGHGIDAAVVEVVINGSGEIELAGATDTLNATIDGSGDMELDELIATDARAYIGGSGTIRVHATAALNAEVSGSGTIRYSGDATIQSRISGSGEIIPD